MKVKEQLEVRKDMYVIEHDMTINHTYAQIKVKEQHLCCCNYTTTVCSSIMNTTNILKCV